VANLSTIANIVFKHEYQDAGFTQGMNAGAAAANQAAAAAQKLAGSTATVTSQVTAALPSWQSINKATDENAKLTAATERANNKLAAQIAALRLEATKSAEVAAGAAETERRLIAIRDAAVAKATLQAEQERARWAGVTNGAANATGAFGNLSRVAGSAGQQLQDVVVQAQMGTSAFTILAQQGSQFLGGFGPGGAVAGAALAIGAVALAALGLTGNVKSLDDAVKESAANFERVTSAAEERVKGYKAESEAIDTLAASYTAMGSAAAKAEGVILARQNKQLNTSAADLTESLGGRLASDLRQREGGSGPAIANFEDVTGLANQAPKLAADLTSAVDAFRQFRDAGGATVETLRLYIGALDDAAKAGGGNAAAITALRDKAIDAIPQITSLEKAMRDNAVQAVAMRLAAGESVESLTAAGAAAGTAAGGFNQLSPSIIAAGAALRQLRKDATDDPLKSVNAELSRVADLAAALNNGGTPAYERYKDAQTAAAKAQSDLNAVTKKFIADRSLEVGADQATAEAKANRTEWLAQIEELQRAEAALARNVAATTKAESEAEAAAKRRATAAETAAKQAAEAQKKFDEAHYSEARLSSNGPLLSLGEADEKAMAVIRRTAAAFNAEQDKITKSVGDAAREAAKEQEAAAKQATDSVVRYASDAFADLFKGTAGGWQQMWQNFLGTARATLARIAAEALLRPIIQPVVMALVGGTGSGSSGSSGGSLGSITGMFSQIQSGGGLLQSAGITGSGGGGSMFSGLPSLSGIGDTVNGWGASSGLFGNGISPLAQGPTLSGAPLGATSEAGFFGTSTATGALGGIAGGIGLGMAGGSIVGGMRGSVNTQQNAMIGSLAGAGIGFLVGGPVGALIGGAIGGTASGFFGPTEKGMAERSGGDVAYANVGGQLQIIGGGGKRTDMAANYAQVQEQLTKINGALSARGLQLDGGMGMVGFGQASKNPGAVNAAGLVPLLRSDDANVRTALSGAGGKTLEQVMDDVDFVQKIYNPLTKTGKATSAFQQQIEALASKFGVVIDRAGSLGLATDKLSDDLAQGIADMVAERGKALDAASNGFTSRVMRATGQGGAADILDFDTAAAQQREVWKAQLDAWGLDATDAAIYINRQEAALAAERVNIVRKAAEAVATQERTVWGSHQSLLSRLAKSTGDDLTSQLLAFDVAANNEKANLKTTLEDNFASVDEIAAQMSLLETVQGNERLGIIKDFNQKILDAEQDRARQANGIITGIVDYAKSLRTRPDSPLSVREQYFGASSDFNSTLNRALGGDGTALAGLTASADTFLTASRGVYGSGSGYAADWQRVIDALGSVSAMTPEQLTAVIYQTEMRTQTQILNDSLILLRGEVTALRKEVQLGGAATGRAA